MSVTPFELAKVVALTADEKKATDIVMLDLSKISDVADIFLVCTAANKRLADALVDEIEKKVRINCAEKPAAIEGRAEGSWILMDYGTVLVHIFLPEQREYYRLEKLWGDAPQLSFA